MPSSTTLKPRGRKKERYALKAFLWGVIISAIFIVPYLIKDKGMYVYYGDYNIQIIPFYQTMVDAVRSGSFGWNWYTDLGTSLIGGYGYYSLGSPFFWIMALFPSECVPYVLGPLTILRFGLVALAAYIYLKRYTRDKNHAVIGAMVYAFSGFSLYNMVFHFIDVLLLFPLLLAALDSFVIDRKHGRFAVMVAVCAVVNYYLFVAEVIFCLAYWIVRLATKSYKMERREVLYLIFEAILGVGMALFMLLPSVYNTLGNSRMSETTMTGWTYWLYETGYMYLEILLALFFPPELATESIYVPEFTAQWKSLNCWLPLFGVAGALAVLFNKRKNKWIRVLYGVCAVFAFVPLFNSSFQLFTESKYLRWFFMLSLIMALGSVIALEDPATKWKKSITWNFVLVLIAVVILAVTPTKKADTITIGLTGGAGVFWTFAALALLSIACLCLFIGLYKRNRLAFKRYSCLILSVVLIAAMGTSVVRGKDEGYRNTNIFGLLNKGDELEIDNVQDYRSDVVTMYDYSNTAYDYDSIGTIDFATIKSDSNSYINKKHEENPDYTGEYDNLTMYLHIPGFQCFHSTVSGSVNDLFEGFGYYRATVSNWSIGMYGLRSITSTKYLFCNESCPYEMVDENGDCLLPGWKYYDSQLGFDIYENEYCLPMGFTYDKYMTSAEFEKVPEQYKHLVLMKCLIVSTVDEMFEMTATGLEQVNAGDLTDEDFTQEQFFKDYEERMELTCSSFERDNKGFSAAITTGDKDEYVFFSVPYDSGWSAEVNGESAEIVKASYGFMAVKVPANQTSDIRFNFHTSGFYYGLFVAALCVVMLLIYLAALKMQSLPAPDDGGSPTDGANNKNKNDGGDSGGSSPGGDLPDGSSPGDGDNPNGSDSPNADDTAEKAAKDNAAEDDEDRYANMTLFDIVKETEEQNMMHTYSRVPVVLESGYGALGYDIEGKRYIDFTAGIGVNSLGYSNAKWLDAIEAQADKLQHASNLYYSTTQIQLAEMLCIKTGFNKVFLANSGAEANECAIKVARKYGCDKYGKAHTHIVTLENSFHGRTITTLSATGQEEFHQYFYPFTEGFSHAKANDIESVKAEVNENTCAVMIELIQGEGGVNPLDKEFVTQLAEYCKENDILLIVDEVQTGVGRTGKLYCYEHYGIQPDILTTAKGLGGGLPIAACMCTQPLQDVMTYGTNGTTYGGNPVACAGAIEVLNRVDRPEFLAEVAEKGDYMREQIKQMRGVKEVRGLGLMIGIVLENDNAKEVLTKCAENGLLVLTAKNLIRLLPPLNIDYLDIDEGLDILEKSIEDTLDGRH